MGMIFLVIIALPKVVDFYSDDKRTIPSGDYLILAKYKESVSDYESSVRYIEKFLHTSTDQDIKEELKKKIAELRKKQINDTTPFQFERGTSPRSPTTNDEKPANQ